MKEEKRERKNSIDVGVAQGDLYTRTRGCATHATNTAVNIVSDGMEAGRTAHSALRNRRAWGAARKQTR